MFDHSFPACAFFFKVEISSHTPIPLFPPGSVYSGTASARVVLTQTTHTMWCSSVNWLQCNGELTLLLFKLLGDLLLVQSFPFLHPFIIPSLPWRCEFGGFYLLCLMKLACQVIVITSESGFLFSCSLVHVWHQLNARQNARKASFF